ncbi:TPA: UilS family quorum-quenching N-acyl-homoserine lactonase [Escherichia coli]|uniref:Alpha/beta fold family hydrolase n=2 Tax=Escherichia coli TaxID=562 RepID=A0A2Y8KEL2_ECOLX|nr:alpha/beta fold hydrolase [Escherichia coli]EFA4219137.1 alpha/beta hydrolase [Escherichia coli O19:H42]EFA4233179.1 alpha/beta hydrolase [Escherichia coli O40:H32]EFA4307630.1 alpha/beta hydrolase [Escherichia coli O19]EEU9511878.1 alpha/beta hydrolase [Escherichia coli]EEZ6065952.1 alpha/beta hydrolase [Escherichia coli]
MIISTHKISEGITLTTRSPSGGKKRPAIILCHGFCGIREILLPQFAEVFTQAGFVTITFDYRGFGDSDGERGRLIPEMQIDDIVTVINWAKEQPFIDKERVGLWGTSLGGGHVFGAAVKGGGVKCIVSQLAFADGEKNITHHMSSEEKKEFISTLEKLDAVKKASGREKFVSITRVLNDNESKKFFEENRTQYPDMDIKIPFLTVKEMLDYKPVQYAAQVTCPSLIVVAEKDTVNPKEQGIELYNSVMHEDKQLYFVNNARHYDTYSGEYFDEISAVETEWFKYYLL